jgi:phosphoribosylformimino-5-aminoimidazole carboxamide ribonucleotide (ProFAR) isomerase
VERLSALIRTTDAEFLVAGGVRDTAVLTQLRDADVAGVILGEALVNGSIDYGAALAVAA